MDVPRNRTLTGRLCLGCKCQFHVRYFLYSSMTFVIASSLCIRMAWNERRPILLLIYSASRGKRIWKDSGTITWPSYALQEKKRKLCMVLYISNLNWSSMPGQAQYVCSFLYPLKAASRWDFAYAKECHNHDAGPPGWHAVSVSHSGIQYSGFPLHCLQKHRWAHSRWTCHSQHLQDPKRQQGKTEGQGKFSCQSCAVPPGKLGDEGGTHGEEDKLMLCCCFLWKIHKYNEVKHTVCVIT